MAKQKDPKVGTGKKPKGSDRRLYTDENPKDTVSIKYATVEDASMQVWEGLHKEETMEKVIVLLDAGLTVEEITKVIVFAGFVEGKFTPDVGLLLTPIVAKMIMAIGKNAGIEKININVPKQDDTKELIKTVIKATPKEVDEKKEVKEDTPDTGLMGKPKKEEK